MTNTKQIDNKLVTLNKSAESGLSETQSSRQQIMRMTELHEMSRDELDALKLVYPGMASQGVLNVFRELRTKLLQESKGKNFICLVSSLCEGGGASYVSMNLSAVFALDKAKTALLVDCNLRDPSAEKLIGHAPEYGLTDYLDDSSLDIPDIIYASGIPRLRVIPVGANHEGGAEYYSSLRMANFFSAIRERYPDRFIIVDAPSVLSSAEARILSDLCDKVILVVPFAKVTESQIQAGIDTIDKNKLVGVVFNKV